MQTVKLNNSIKCRYWDMVYFKYRPKECERCVLDTIDAGYRLIDTAQAYYNEGAWVMPSPRCSVSRDELSHDQSVDYQCRRKRQPAASTNRSVSCAPITSTCCLSINRLATIREHGGRWRKSGKGRKSPCHWAIEFLSQPLRGYGRMCRNKTCRKPTKTNVFSQQVGC